MFDIGWLELLFVAVLALVIVGPKDLPSFVRSIGHIFAKFRRIYRDSIESLHRLQHEIDVASQPAPQDDIPDYYAFLPEHIKQMLYSDSPVRDRAEAERREAIFNQAVDEARTTYQQQQAQLSSPPAEKK